MWGVAAVDRVNTRWKLESLGPIEWVLDHHGFAAGGRPRWCSLVPDMGRFGIDCLGHLNRKRVMYDPSRGETVHQQASRSALEPRNDVSVAAVPQDGGIRARSIK
jgi:hypothetical protein